jgi:hypothetical protein
VAETKDFKLDLKDIDRAFQVAVGAAWIALISQIGGAWEKPSPENYQLRAAIFVGLNVFGSALALSIAASTVRYLLEAPEDRKLKYWLLLMLPASVLAIAGGFWFVMILYPFAPQSAP